MPRLTIVIPTYNEKENLPLLLGGLAKLNLPDWSVLVVDDNSPDGTGQIAENLASKYPVQILHQKQKNGIGVAYAEGFKKILSGDAKPEFVLQMDADLSHHPEVIPLMLSQMKDYDLVLGSRYVPGGNIANWNFIRRLISRFGNFYARLILGLPYHDLTGGFKCFRREVLEKIGLDGLNSIGYCFQIETTFRAHRLGFKIAEVPIVFTERKTGTSKFSLLITLEAFWKVFLLRFRT